MKSNRELLVSFYNGKADNLPRGTKLSTVPLYDILCKDGGLHAIDKSLPKGHSGSIFAYVQTELGLNEDRTNFADGIVFIDVDKMQKSTVKKIYDSFEILSKRLPNILSCWFSSSYYNDERDYGGLHFVIRVGTDSTFYNEYKYFVGLYGAILARVIYQCCGIDIRPNDGVGLDKATKSLAQRFFLNHSEVKWNDDAYVIDPQMTESDKEQLKSWVNEFNSWLTKSNEYKITKCQFNSIDISTYNGNKINLGFYGRINIINSLYRWGVSESEIERLMLDICGPDDWEGDKKNPGALLRSIRQTIYTARNQHPSPEQMALAKERLSAVGINADILIEKIYQPIEDKSLESLFEEVWLEEKNKLPENYLKVHLKEGEYLSDHEDTITPMIKKYTMTYLNLDCAGGKSTYALKMIAKEIVPTLFEDSFVMMVKGNSVDLCVPYNSVADDKSKGSRRDVKRLKTQCITDFDENKRNVFIWNTVMPMYEKYFNLGTVKRLVLFFDESQKIVTDDYRWETVFDMFKVLPVMYKHFVFMTGTPAYEHEFLLQYFPDWCCINITNESPYKKSCNILKYKQFGNGDRVNLIESEIEAGRLPLIYSNTKNDSWKQAVMTINKNRVESGLRPLRVLEFDRPNAENLGTVMNTNSIKDYDVVIATKYCSVGIDFMKDDDRVRCSIVDYANENDCCFHDIWQFAARNRLQDMMIKIIARDDDKYYKKLPTISRIERLCKAKAILHTTGDTAVVNDENDIVSMHNVLNDIFKERKFGRLIKRGFFNDSKNVTLLESYYKYVLIFSNMNMIKHMLIRRGVELTETEMEHAEEKIDMSYKKEIYGFFVDNFDAISRINDDRCGHDKMSYKIPINDNRSEYMQDNKIYTRNTAYTNWLIKNFAGREEWIEILKDRDYISKEMFAAYNRISMIADKLDKKQIKLLKTLKETIEDIEDIDMIADLYDSLVLKLVRQHYDYEVDVNSRIDREEYEEVLTDYKKILQFAVDNIEYIEDIRKKRETGERMTAIHKMKITMEQKDNERRINKISKTKSKKYTVKFKNGVVKTFNGQQEMMKYFKVSKPTIVKLLNGENCKLSKNIVSIE